MGHQNSFEIKFAYIEANKYSIMKKVFSPFYFILFLLFALAELYTLASGNSELEHVVKPFIMLSIIVFFGIGANRKHALFIPALVAFIFSLLGDVLLMFNQRNELFFLTGLAAFLIAHLVYIVTFNIKPKAQNKKKTKIVWAHGVVVAMAGILYFLLFPNLDKVMKIAVFLYTAAITAMVLSALQRKQHVEILSYRLVLIGALLFLLSDSLLAINRFWIEIPWGSIWVMATYMPAQFLIYLGLLQQSKAE